MWGCYFEVNSDTWISREKKKKKKDEGRKKISTQRLNIFGIPLHWFSEGSCVINVYTWAVVEVG
jgi:hypothetical protein